MVETLEGIDAIPLGDFKKKTVGDLQGGKSFIVSAEGEFLGFWIRPTTDHVYAMAEQLIFDSNCGWNPPVEEEDADTNGE